MTAGLVVVYYILVWLEWTSNITNGHFLPVPRSLTVVLCHQHVLFSEIKCTDIIRKVTEPMSALVDSQVQCT